ncbi:odorant receptor 94a-like [Pieris brassicae]|nr:odorant receptor 94a-like [Pieris brassicae]
MQVSKKAAKVVEKVQRGHQPASRISEWSSAGECVAIHTRVLRFVGFLRGYGLAHALYRRGVLAITTLYLVQECVYAYKVRSNLDKLSRVMFLLLCHVTSLAKQLVFHFDSDAVKRLIDALDNSVFQNEDDAAMQLVNECTRRAWRVEVGYAGCAVLTCTLWLLFPIRDHAQGLHVEFPFASPESTDASPMFAAILLYSYYVTTLVGIANTTVDAFIATIIYQCQTQFRILRMEMEKLPDTARTISEARKEAYETALTQQLAQRLLHYRHITWMAESVQEIFGKAILVQFGIGGWILCMAAYKLVSLSVLSIEFASMALFISCILTELYLYCYFGTELSVESSNLAGSVYAMQWVGAPAQFRRSLLIVMECARRPLRPTASTLVPLSLDTFLKILKSSYTFYAVLRQTK